MKPFRFLDTGPISAAANMALDRIILEEVARQASPPTLRFLQFKPSAALVGYHQDVNLEIRQEFCRAHGIDINRRHTGGGAILFQESALGWEFFGVPGEEPCRGSYETILRKICGIAASGLSRFGIPACFRPRNDIEVEGRKISGTGGVMISGGVMFQGTLLVQNEVELFLRALRVPVEKLKKREIQSLMERICFLSDLLTPTPSVDRIKEAMAAEFQEQLGGEMIPGALTDNEARRLADEIDYFKSSTWIMSRSRPPHEGEPVRSITQTEAGTLRVHLWMAPGGRRVRQALIAGDFFTVPARLIQDLEASLVGIAAEPNSLRSAVKSFFGSTSGHIIGIEPERVADAVASSAERLALLDGCFSPTEVNDLFLLNIAPTEFYRLKPRWLLLPYCSKNLDCSYRQIPGCDECGQCEIGECFEIARSFNMDPITVQSFEHLMEVLRTTCTREDAIYVGSCCEAFYSKHQEEMEQVKARGVLVNLDSTTCYDLGKASLAYRGNFDNKTNLNLDLIAKTLRHLNA